MRWGGRVLLVWLACWSMACTPTQLDPPAPTPSSTVTANGLSAAPTATAGGLSTVTTASPIPVPATIAVSPTATPQPFGFLYASDASGRGELYINNGVGQSEPISLSDEVESAWQPALSPDGQIVAFTGRREGQSDIALIPLNGGTVTWLTDDPADDFDPAWSPDGERLAWVSERAGQAHVWTQERGGPGDLWVGEGESATAPEQVPIPFGERPTRAPAFAPDGTLYFSAVDNDGAEYLYSYDFTTRTLTPRTAWPIKGTHPAINGAGEVAFIGWEDNPPWRGIYRLYPDGRTEKIWETTDWIGDLSWSQDGAWLLFTRAARTGAGHDIWASPVNGGEPYPLTNAPSWESDPISQRLVGPTAPPVAVESPAPPPDPLPFAYGFNVANLDNAYLSRELGMTWAKGFAFWERIEEAPGVYDWRDVDNTVQRYEEAGLQIMLRVDRTPTWARPPETVGSYPPTNLDAYARFLEELATRYRGRVAAYELWNEPNLSFEWGYTYPDPAYYVEMLRVARPALQRGDPDAQLIVGALAVTGNSDVSMDELEWMAAFYAALGDPAGWYDGFSTHPYGLGQPPDLAPTEGLGLRRLEQHRAQMEAHGDTVPLWLTEIGYTRYTPAWPSVDQEYLRISDDLQAQYMADTFTYLETNYPYVAGAFIFNLDFSVVDWYDAGESMRTYAILDAARRPLPAYSALRERWLGR